jgi:hypothetical protein
VKRLADLVEARIEQALADTEMPAADREALEWESAVAVGMDGTVHWVVGLSLPVPGTGNWEMPFAVLDDPHDPQAIKDLCRALYDKAVSLVAAATPRLSAGGLIVP